MKITINDIAKAANVAKSTVSKVLNDAPSISEATKEKVRAVMREMNYEPSSLATRLAKQKGYNVGLVIDLTRKSDFLNASFYDIIGGVESVIGPLDYELTISNIEHVGRERFVSRFVLGRKVDGLIMDNSILTPELAGELNGLKFPYVSIGEIPGMAPLCWVDINNRRGAAMLTSHLFARGYRNPAFIGGERGDPMFEARVAGYREVLVAEGIRGGKEAEAGPPVPSGIVLPGYANEANGRRLVRELLALPSVPDAIICMSNLVAFGALEELRGRGVSIPDEMGVATFDNRPLAPFTTPPLTCLDMDTFALGAAAGEMLMAQINESEAALSGRRRWVEPKLVVRRSTEKETT
ncbi:LacI family DNA-binding transcriptional regulator [Paenibacillus sp. TH7-28]